MATRGVPLTWLYMVPRADARPPRVDAGRSTVRPRAGGPLGYVWGATLRYFIVA